MNQTLLLIDIQNDYFPGGAMELAGSSEAGVRAGKLLQVYRQKSLPVIHIQHISTGKGAAFFLPDTKGVLIHESVAPVKGETVFQKNYPNSFRETALLDHLRQQQITRLVIAGMMTHLCIDTTTRAAVGPWLPMSLSLSRLRYQIPVFRWSNCFSGEGLNSIFRCAQWLAGQGIIGRGSVLNPLSLRSSGPSRDLFYRPVKSKATGPFSAHSLQIWR